MEALLDAIGAFALIFLILIGLGAGYLVGKIAGQNKSLYLVVGVVAAIATPFVLAALGIGVLAAGGLILLALVSAIGALVVLALVQVLFGRG
jgi:uncharacterized membrane protein YeaQ/YmgE (transglycosylase-associated protein family)